jgi:hypothetical protein
MKKTPFNSILKFGKQLDALNQADDRVRAMRAKLAESLAGGYWTSTQRNATELIVSLTLPKYLEIRPDEKPVMVQWQDQDGKPKGYMRYPAIFSGWIRDGYGLWVDARTPQVDLPAPSQDTREAA